MPVILALLLLSLTSCSSLTTIEQVFAGEGQKTGLLSVRADKYHRAIYWGSFEEAMKYVSPSDRAEVMQSLRKIYSDKKVVDISIEDMQFTDGGDEASVEVKVRAYKNPTYVVQAMKEKQTWSYHRIEGGWLLSKVEVLEENLPAGSNGPPLRIPRAY